MSVTNFSNISSYTQRFNVANITRNIFQYDTPLLSSNILISNIYSSTNIIVLGNTINNNNIFINQNSNIYANIFSPNINTDIYNNSNIISRTFYINLNNNFNHSNVLSNISSTIGNLTIYNTNINGNINVLNNSNILNNFTCTGNIFFNNSLFVLPQFTTSILPLGIIMPLRSSTIPNGWLLCNGQAISRTTYSNLFNLIGTTYGLGDGANTFNIPNINERLIFGIDSTNTYGLGLTSLNLTGGGNTQTLSISHLPQHTHDVGSLSIGSHTHTLVFNNGNYFETFESGAIGRQTGDQLSERQTNVRAWTTLTDNTTTAISGTFNNTGNSVPFSILPPYVYLNFIIRVY
jgi:microcystin-dependent protein